jgi:hypothetical protein
VRSNRLVVGSVLTAALALIALPGLAGSRALSPIQPVPDSAFQQLSLIAQHPGSSLSIAPLDDAYRSAGTFSRSAPIVEGGGTAVAAPGARVGSNPPGVAASSSRKPARFTLTGGATFYDNGTTAMRLPRGTLVVICGAGGCIERVVNDYGPQKPSRVVDLYRPDFFAICGCPSFAGTTQVTVYVY